MTETAGPHEQAAPKPVLRLERVPARLALRTRLAVFAALSIALVISITTYLQSRTLARTVELELVDTARVTALAIVNDAPLNARALSADAVKATLDEFLDADPELRSIAVVTVVHGQPDVFASTASADQERVLALGRRAIETRTAVWNRDDEPLRMLAVPFTKGRTLSGAVTVSLSFASLARIRDSGRRTALWSTLIAVAVLFVFVELLMRYYIHRPIDAIRKTMMRVAEGRMDARAPVLRPDELGAVADGLNDMLRELEDLHAGLQLRVAQATLDVRTRNRELLEMYEQMFQLRDELGRTQQLAAIGETASAVAHQIGTPLNLVSGHIQMLIEEQGPGSPVTRRLQIAEDQLRKVAGIVEGLLGRSRRHVVRGPLDLCRVTGRLCTLVKPVLETAGVTLVYDAAGAAMLDGDEPQLELALLNLVANAIDAMPDGGTLTIRVGDAGGRVRVEVRDTGTGIAPELAERIFEPWFTTKPEGRGTGLGLSIARRVVADHGGLLTLQESSPQGSCFVVELSASGPAAEEPAHA
jgi:two-component system, NtrC family, sensor kinase